MLYKNLWKVSRILSSKTWETYHTRKQPSLLNLEPSIQFRTNFWWGGWGSISLVKWRLSQCTSFEYLLIKNTLFHYLLQNLCSIQMDIETVVIVTLIQRLKQDRLCIAIIALTMQHQLGVGNQKRLTFHLQTFHKKTKVHQRSKMAEQVQTSRRETILSQCQMGKFRTGTEI